jgi:hypothetical protein
MMDLAIKVLGFLVLGIVFLGGVKLIRHYVLPLLF